MQQLRHARRLGWRQFRQRRAQAVRRHLRGDVGRLVRGQFLENVRQVGRRQFLEDLVRLGLVELGDHVGGFLGRQPAQHRAGVLDRQPLQPVGNIRRVQARQVHAGNLVAVILDHRPRS